MEEVERNIATILIHAKKKVKPNTRYRTLLRDLNTLGPSLDQYLTIKEAIATLRAININPGEIKNLLKRRDNTKAFLQNLIKINNDLTKYNHALAVTRRNFNGIIVPPSIKRNIAVLNISGQKKKGEEELLRSTAAAAAAAGGGGGGEEEVVEESDDEIELTSKRNRYTVLPYLQFFLEKIRAAEAVDENSSVLEDMSTTVENIIIGIFAQAYKISIFNGEKELNWQNVFNITNLSAVFKAIPEAKERVAEIETVFEQYKNNNVAGNYDNLIESIRGLEVLRDKANDQKIAKKAAENLRKFIAPPAVVENRKAHIGACAAYIATSGVMSRKNTAKLIRVAGGDDDEEDDSAAEQGGGSRRKKKKGGTYTMLEYKQPIVEYGGTEEDEHPLIMKLKLRNPMIQEFQDDSSVRTYIALILRYISKQISLYDKPPPTLFDGFDKLLIQRSIEYVLGDKEISDIPLEQSEKEALNKLEKTGGCVFNIFGSQLVQLGQEVKDNYVGFRVLEAIEDNNYANVGQNIQTIQKLVGEALVRLTGTSLRIAEQMTEEERRAIHNAALMRRGLGGGRTRRRRRKKRPTRRKRRKLKKTRRKRGSYHKKTKRKRKAKKTRLRKRRNKKTRRKR